jgi:hypothetical protein
MTLYESIQDIHGLDAELAQLEKGNKPWLALCPPQYFGGVSG